VHDLGDIGARLSSYLGTPVSGLRVLASGWETTVFEFTISSRSARFQDIPVNVGLVLRFHQGPFADDKGAREYAAMRLLSAVHYPVAHPYAYEPDHGALGAPFLVMHRLSGGPLFSTHSFPAALKTFSLAFFDFVRTQVRLHRMRPADFPDMPHSYRPAGALSDAPLLERMLSVIEDRIERGPLPGLRGAFDRLNARAPLFRNAPSSLVHMDYHPLNVMVRGLRVTGVIDWVFADVGDRHLDAATTATILSSSAFEHPRWMRDNAVGNSLRALFASLYIPLYHAMAPMDLERFRYCQAIAALQRLSMLGMMRARGAETVGFRPESVQEVTPAVVRLLSRYASRKSGTAVGLDVSSAMPA